MRRVKDRLVRKKLERESVLEKEEFEEKGVHASRTSIKRGMGSGLKRILFYFEISNVNNASCFAEAQIRI